MFDRRDWIAIVATITADSAWLYPVLGVIGFIFRQGESLLPLPLVFVMIFLGVVTARMASGVSENSKGRASFQALLSLGAIYIAMSMAQSGFDILWGLRLLGGDFSGKAATGLIAGTLVAGFLWRRGGQIAVEFQPKIRLLRTFRAGIVALSGSMLFEKAFDLDVAATEMLLPFFAVSLTGMVFARLPPGGSWTRIAGLTVSVVISGGLVIGLIGASVGGRGLGLLAAGWSNVVYGVGWVLAPVVEAIFEFLTWLIGDYEQLPRRSPKVRQRQATQPFDIFPDGMPPFVDFTIHLIKYPLLLLSIYLLYRLLRWAYQSYARRAREAVAVAVAEERESIRGDANPTSDLIKLALGLLPDWLIPAASPTGPRYPKNVPGISEVYTLYFGLMTAARDHGYDFTPSMTPSERRADLEIAVPGAPVAEITDCFNAACYGNIATDHTTLARLRRELEAA